MASEATATVSHSSTPDRGAGDPGRGVLIALRRIMQAVDLYSRRLSRECGLTGPQLLCLREMRAAGAITPGQLARTLSLSPPTISGILDRLEARGLITRNRRVRDKRQVRLELTAEGRTVVDRAPSPLQEIFLKRLADLPVKRQQVIAGTLDEVVELLRAQDLDAAPILEGTATHAAGHSVPVDIEDETGWRIKQRVDSKRE